MWVARSKLHRNCTTEGIAEYVNGSRYLTLKKLCKALGVCTRTYIAIAGWRRPDIVGCN